MSSSDTTCISLGSRYLLQLNNSTDNVSIHNLKQKMTDEGSIPEQEYRTLIEKPTESQFLVSSRIPLYLGQTRVTDSSHVADDVELKHQNRQDMPAMTATRCLFCSMKTEGMESSVDHMLCAHGLFIPSPEKLLDLNSFIQYLTLIVFEYKECLFCGSMKTTSEAVQAHMRDSGHCKLNLDADSELHEFWVGIGEDAEDSGIGDSTRTAASLLSDSEMILPSGLVINQRNSNFASNGQHRTARMKFRGTHESSRDFQLETKSHGLRSMGNLESRKMSGHRDIHAAIRNEMGLVGVSDSQKRVLRAIEKKMQAQQKVAKAAYRHAMEQQPKKAIYYKVSTLLTLAVC